MKTLRERARQHIEGGPVTPSYGGDPKKTIEILQAVLATEIVCVLRYTQHAIVATGLASDSVKAEFTEHAARRAGARHAGGRAHQPARRRRPTSIPDTLTARSAAEYQTGDDLVGMIRENLIAERIAVEHYRELVRYFGDNDPATRMMIEGILAKEEEHASDMLDLLTRHGGLDG